MSLSFGVQGRNIMAVAINQSATGNTFIDGLIDGPKWDGEFTFSFPQAAGSF